MLDDHGFEIYEENEYPLAFLLTFRTYGTWLHGDDRWSVSRTANPTKIIAPNVPLEERMESEMDQPPVFLDDGQRRIVEMAIAEVCGYKNYLLHAANVLSSHAHAVISAHAKPERIVDALKAYSTRHLREAGRFDEKSKIWFRGRSRRYLWKPRHVEAAIEYVLYSQGDLPFELTD